MFKALKIIRLVAKYGTIVLVVVEILEYAHDKLARFSKDTEPIQNVDDKKE